MYEIGWHMVWFQLDVSSYPPHESHERPKPNLLQPLPTKHKGKNNQYRNQRAFLFCHNVPRKQTLLLARIPSLLGESTVVSCPCRLDDRAWLDLDGALP
jgi:hypothetical protein